jgi:hypothetical protein
MKHITIFAAAAALAVPGLCCCASSKKEAADSQSFDAASVSNIFITTQYDTLKTMEVYTLNSAGFLVKSEAKIIEDKDDESVGLQFRSNGGTYNLFVPINSVIAYSVSVDKYLDDFEKQNLSRKDKDSYKKYESVKCRVEWGPFSKMANSYAEPEAQFGYMFKKRTPYFTITAWQSKNLAEHANYSETTEFKDMQTLYVFMTKAQAQELETCWTNAVVAARMNKQGLPPADLQNKPDDMYQEKNQN